MAINFLKEKSIKYLNKDFQTVKRDLMNFSQAHHSGSFQDYNESSPGMALLEFVAVAVDMLSFYQDAQFEEVRQENARQIENVVSFAKSQGYRPSGKRAARTSQTFFIEVPATTLNGESVPNDTYSGILNKGSKVQGPDGIVFETLDDIHFSASAPTPNTLNHRFVTGSQFDAVTGMPTHFALRKDVEVIAGETQVEDFTITDFEKFKTIELSNADVIEVLSVVDSDGNEWTEVEFLAQEMVYDAITNSSDDSDVVPYVLKLRAVPRRFVTDRDPLTQKTSLIFGSGDGVNFDDDLVPNLADMSLPLPGRRTFSSFAIDPQNFLKTQTLGLSPFNTTLTVSYRVGGGAQTNVAPGTIKSVLEASFDFTSTSLSPGLKSAVIGSLETFNVNMSEGGAGDETISEIQANRAAYFAAQNRTVTREDFMAHVLSMPAKFGKPEKVYVKRNNINGKAVDIHILAKDSDGHLKRASSTLMNNVRTYLLQKRMLTDGVNLLHSDIMNMKLDFGIVVGPKLNRQEILAKCLKTLGDYFHVDKMQIGQPIVLSDVSAELQKIYGVISVYKLEFKNAFGTQDSGAIYSGTRFDVRASTQSGIIYCPENAIFEVKFPRRDIFGETK